MAAAPPHTDAEVVRAARVPLVQVGAIVGAAWLLYLLRVAFDIDVLGMLRRSPDAEPLPLLPYLAFALTLTVVGVPVAVLAFRSNQRLLKTGVRTDARFVKRGLVAKHGQVPVTFAYTVEGVEYFKKRDVPTVFADHYDESTRVPVVVDPRKPSRCLV